MKKVTNFGYVHKIVEGIHFCFLIWGYSKGRGERIRIMDAILSRSLKRNTRTIRPQEIFAAHSHEYISFPYDEYLDGLCVLPL